jgi:hypothetical protein
MERKVVDYSKNQDDNPVQRLSSGDMEPVPPHGSDTIDSATCTCIKKSANKILLFGLLAYFHRSEMSGMLHHTVLLDTKM